MMEKADQRRRRPLNAMHKQGGFSIFELMAYIIVVSITVSVAYNRFADFPGEAERANFLAVMGQLRAGVNLQMISATAGGKWQELERMEGSNPMDLMLQTPVNYVGAFSSVDESALPRRTWYFNRQQGELVYLANDSRNLYAVANGNTVPADQVRFRIMMKYGPLPNQDWEGLVLEAVPPYRWETIGLDLPEAMVE